MHSDDNVKEDKDSTALASLWDVGANLGHDAFASDARHVMDRASAAGVQCIATGTSLAAVQRIQELGIPFTAGLHPHRAQHLPHEMELASYMTHPQCVAIGETGLDYDRMASPKEEQRKAFAWHIEWAIRTRKPLFLHVRDALGHDTAFREALAMVGNAQQKHGSENVRGIVHCFTGTATQARAWQSLGLHLGITGWATQDRGAPLRDVLRSGAVELNHLHIETDAPYLWPANAPRSAPFSKMRTHRGTMWRNEPCALPYILEHVAQTMNVPTTELRNHLANNAMQLFQLAPPPSPTPAP